MKAWMRINPKVLVNMMYLPSETQIYDIQFRDEYLDAPIWILIEHPDIHSETVTPVISQVFDDAGNLVRTNFLNWRE